MTGAHIGAAVASGLFAVACLAATIWAFDDNKPLGPLPLVGTAFLALTGLWIVAVGVFVDLANAAP